MHAPTAEFLLETFLRVADEGLKLIDCNARDDYALTLSLEDENFRGLIVRDD